MCNPVATAAGQENSEAGFLAKQGAEQAKQQSPHPGPLRHPACERWPKSTPSFDAPLPQTTLAPQQHLGRATVCHSSCPSYCGPTHWLSMSQRTVFILGIVQMEPRMEWHQHRTKLKPDARRGLGWSLIQTPTVQRRISSTTPAGRVNQISFSITPPPPPPPAP